MNERSVLKTEVQAKTSFLYQYTALMSKDAVEIRMTVFEKQI